MNKEEWLKLATDDPYEIAKRIKELLKNDFAVEVLDKAISKNYYILNSIDTYKLSEKELKAVLPFFEKECSRSSFFYYILQDKSVISDHFRTEGNLGKDDKFKNLENILGQEHIMREFANLSPLNLEIFKEYFKKNDGFESYKESVLSEKGILSRLKDGYDCKYLAESMDMGGARYFQEKFGNNKEFLHKLIDTDLKLANKEGVFGFCIKHQKDADKYPFISEVFDYVKNSNKWTSEQHVSILAQYLDVDLKLTGTILDESMPLTEIDLVKKSAEIVIDKHPEYFFKILAYAIENDNGKIRLKDVYGEAGYNELLDRACSKLKPEIYGESIEKIRMIFNNLDDAPDSERFHMLKNFSAGQVFSLLSHRSEDADRIDELSASTFNKLFDDLNKKMEKDNIRFSDLIFPQENLKIENFNLYNIKQDAGLDFVATASLFNRGGEILKKMDFAQQSKLIDNIVERIDFDKDPKFGIVLAELGKYESPELKKYIENKLEHMSAEAKTYESRTLFSLTASLYHANVNGDVSGEHKKFFNKIVTDEKYKLAKIDGISIKQLTDKKGVHTEIISFYDDDNGRASHESYMKLFNDTSKWKVHNKGDYIVVNSVNSKIPINIYITKPDKENATFDEKGQFVSSSAFWQVERHLKEANPPVKAQLFVHHGLASNVLESAYMLPKESKLVIIASPSAGYSRIMELADKAKDAQIIYSKNNGAGEVYNSILNEIYTKLREGKDIKWNDIWEKVDGLKGLKSSDYVNPVYNKDIQFIRFYEKLLPKDNKEIGMIISDLKGLYQTQDDKAKEGRELTLNPDPVYNLNIHAGRKFG